MMEGFTPRVRPEIVTRTPGQAATPMLYQLHEFSRALLNPAVEFAGVGARIFSAPGSWLAQLPGSARIAASYELMYRMGKDYPKPVFGIDAVDVPDARVSVVERAVMVKPFCRLLRFCRHSDDAAVISGLQHSPNVLVVAPYSGHHATLVRDTVRALLSDHDVYVTDWANARLVPVEHGPFTLDDYVAYIRQFIRFIGADRLHVLSVCQPCVPVLAAASLMAAAGEPVPRSLTMMGGPVDARQSPTQVNDLAMNKPASWFEMNLLDHVPSLYPGRGRRVYPGFLQHAGFIAMNPGRHMSSHWDFYDHLVEGDLEDAAAHRRFYDEYNAVLDLPAEYYMDCIRIVFQQYLLPRGLWNVAGERVDPAALSDTALFTIEGELDDISGRGQTLAAHDLCRNIPRDRKRHLMVEGAGHYGIFSGRRWRESVYPRVKRFIAAATPAVVTER
jgi:poly(3-hydroxybutyrate) depolymerase